MRAKVLDYDTMYNESTGNTETHIAADEMINKRNALQDFGSNSAEDAGSLGNAYEEGFASASGVRGETVATGGRIKHPETQDEPMRAPASSSIDKENSGLADN